MQARIAELEATVDSLMAKNSSDWLTAQRADEIRSVVEDVLADSEMRASLLQGGGTAGWDNGFMLASADGNYELNISGQEQIRWGVSYIDDAFNSTDHGFENRRTKLVFDGHIVDPSISYKVQMEFSRSGGGAGLQDAYVAKDYGNGWTIKLGQMKGPLLREELVSSARQQAAERSLLNEMATLDRVQGIAAMYQGDTFRGGVMYHDGRRSMNTAILGSKSASVSGGTKTEFSLAARGEYLVSGNWGQFKDFASWSGEEAGFMIGGGVNFDKGASGTAFGGMHGERFTWTLDGSYEGGGWNVFAAVIGDHTSNTGGPDVDSIGVILQGGIFVTEDVDVFARFEWADADLGPGVDDLSVLTIGMNKYWDKHNLKWTNDIGFGLENTSYWSNGGATYRGGEDEVVIRSQLQLLF